MRQRSFTRKNRHPLEFLLDLSTHNDRGWFQENKPRYHEFVEKPARSLLEELIPKLSELVSFPLDGKIFRIHRDVRFSKDKTPYNPHIRMAVYPHDLQARESGIKPCFYFSLEPGKTIVGAGTIALAKNALDVYRGAVGDETAGPKLAKVLRAYKEADGYRLGEPALKRVPSGYPSDHPRATLLRNKSLTVWHEETPPPALQSPKAVVHLIRRYKKLKPVFDWLDVLK